MFEPRLLTEEEAQWRASCGWHVDKSAVVVALVFRQLVDAGVFASLLKITFAMTNAISMAASRKPRSSIADQASTSAFLSAVSLTSSVIASADLDLL